MLKKGDEIEADGARDRQGEPARIARRQAARRQIRGATSTAASRSATSSRARSPRSPASARSSDSTDDIDGLVHISQLSEDHVEQGQGRDQGGRRSGSPRHQGGQGRAPHRPLDQGGRIRRGTTPQGKRQPSKACARPATSSASSRPSTSPPPRPRNGARATSKPTPPPPAAATRRFNQRAGGQHSRRVFSGPQGGRTRTGSCHAEALADA